MQNFKFQAGRFVSLSLSVMLLGGCIINPPPMPDSVLRAVQDQIVQKFAPPDSARDAPVITAMPRPPIGAMGAPSPSLAGIPDPDVLAEAIEERKARIMRARLLAAQGKTTPYQDARATGPHREDHPAAMSDPRLQTFEASDVSRPDLSPPIPPLTPVPHSTSGMQRAEALPPAGTSAADRGTCEEANSRARDNLIEYALPGTLPGRGEKLAAAERGFARVLNDDNCSDPAQNEAASHLGVIMLLRGNVDRALRQFQAARRLAYPETDWTADLARVVAACGASGGPYDRLARSLLLKANKHRAEANDLLRDLGLESACPAMREYSRFLTGDTQDTQHRVIRL